MEDFNKVLIKTLAEQLVKGYQIQDNFGNIQNIESPLQILVKKYIEDNKKVFIEEVAKVFTNTDILKEAIKEKIDKDLEIEWIRKSYEEYFTQGLGDKLKKEIVQSLGVLLEGKEITIRLLNQVNK